MTENTGFIKLDRNMLRWRWISTPNTAYLFVLLLLKANYKDMDFQGVKVKRGQLVTSLKTLANTSGLSVDQVRTALTHLIGTGEITSKAYSKYRIITISKYNDYQDVPSNIPVKSQANPKQVPSKSQQEKEYKESKKERIIYTGGENPLPGKTNAIRPEIDLAGFPSAEDMPSEAAGTKRDIPPRVRHLFSDYGAYWRWMHRET